MFDKDNLVKVLYFFSFIILFFHYHDIDTKFLAPHNTD